MQLQVIQKKIHEVRGQKIMLDFDLAQLYEVETRALNQAVKRNIDISPEDFMFQLTAIEWETMLSQIVMTYPTKRPKTALPLAFTEHKAKADYGKQKKFVPRLLPGHSTTLDRRTTRREFLGFYLFDKPKTPVDKQHNKETLQLAEQVRQKRDKQLNENEALTDLEKRLIQKDKKERELEQKEKVRTGQNFVAYFKKLASKRKASNHDIKTTFIVKY